METIKTELKIQISEVEGLTIKIPTTFDAVSFNKFYAQMLAISRIIPTQQLLIKPKPTPMQNDEPIQNDEEPMQNDEVEMVAHVPDSCPERLRIGNWTDKQECLSILNAWGIDKKRGAISWIKRYKGWVLTDREISKVSQLIGSIRSKYKRELGL